MAKSTKPTTAEAPTIMLGPVPITSGEETPARMSLLLWGPATVGKTTFAATAPGVKLWLSLGDQEHVSVMARSDVRVANLSTLSLDDLFKHAQGDNPFGLDQALTKDESIATVVLDSLTALSFRALQKSVSDKVGASRTFTPSMETPGQSAYGGRNSLVLETLTGLMRVTAKHNVHFIVTAHEADAKTKKDDKGNDVIELVTVMLGGQLVNNMTYKLSEIWHLGQLNDAKMTRRLSIRNYGYRKPMKTRMFKGTQAATFDLRYDADQPDDAPGQMTIANWVNEWLDQNGAKLDVPK